MLIRWHLRLGLVVVLRLRLIVGVFFFCLRIFRRATVVLERAHCDGLDVVAGFFANHRADARKASMD